MEALYRYLILEETVHDISHHFGRSASEWRTLRRWRAQLLVSPTLLGWLGSRLGISRPAETRKQGRLHLRRLLGEMRVAWKSAAKVLAKLEAAVRATLGGLLHNRRRAWPWRSSIRGPLGSLVLEQSQRYCLQRKTLAEGHRARHAELLHVNNSGGGTHDRPRTE